MNDYPKQRYASYTKHVDTPRIPDACPYCGSHDLTYDDRRPDMPYWYCQDCDEIVLTYEELLAHGRISE